MIHQITEPQPNINLPQGLGTFALKLNRVGRGLLVVRGQTRLEGAKGRTGSDTFQSVVTGPIVVVGVMGRALRDVTRVDCVSVSAAGWLSDAVGTGAASFLLRRGLAASACE